MRQVIEDDVEKVELRKYVTSQVLQNNIFVITINRPKQSNSMKLGMYIKIAALLNQADEDPNIKVAILKSISLK